MLHWDGNMPGTARYYISNIDAGGRVVILRSDGAEITPSEKTWLDAAISRQLRADLAARKKGTYPDAVILEPDVESGINARTGEVIRVHPLMHKLKRVIKYAGWAYTDLSRMLGKHKAMVSQYLRGETEPKFKDIVSLFGMLGYRMVPVPLAVLDQVQPIVDAAEAEMIAEYERASMGDADDDVANTDS